MDSSAVPQNDKNTEAALHPLFPTLFANFEPLKDEKRLVVCVSGGVDSMVLLGALKAWQLHHPHVQIIAATVDHDLREGSRAEAEFVNLWCDKNRIPHTALKWEHTAPLTSRVMERARMVRYELLAHFAHSIGAKVLVTAHHADDQIETFMMRLMRGSGLSGLVGMREWRTLHSDIKVFRPFLDISKQQLQGLAVDLAIPSVDDPSNDNARFERVRVRQALQAIGLEVDSLHTTLSRLQRAEVALEHMTNAFYTYVQRIAGEQCMGRVIFEEAPHEIQLRILMRLIHVDPTLYPPSLEAVERLHGELMADPQGTVRRTLAGFVITLSPKWLKIAPETGDKRNSALNYP